MYLVGSIRMFQEENNMIGYIQSGIFYKCDGIIAEYYPEFHESTQARRFWTTECLCL